MNQDKIIELKAALPGILSCVDMERESKNSYSAPCPLCGGEDRFVYKTESGRCWCRRCHEKPMDIIDFHCWRYGKAIPELIKEHLPDVTFQEFAPQTIQDLLCRKRGLDTKVVEELIKTERLLMSNHAGKQSVKVPYWSFQGQVKATQYLSIDQEPFPFTAQSGKPANKVFGKGDKPGSDCFFIAGPEPNQANTWIISEAVINALTANQWFPDACCIALGGSTYTRKVEALKPYINATKTVCVAQDNDPAGEKMVQAVYKVLGSKIHALDWSDDDKPGLDINDLLKAGQNERGRRLIQSAPLMCNQDDKNWEAPVSLEDNIPPAMDPNILTGPVGDMARAVSDETETPIELAVGLGLSAIATACQGKITIQVKPGYREPLNIWVVVALDPANRKTSVLSKMTAPLSLWEREQHKQMEPQVRAAQSRRQNQESRIKSLRAKYGKAKPDELEEIEAEILEIENNFEEIPMFPKVWAQDVTPEHLGTLMARHDERMSILSAEGGIFDIAAGRYSNGVPNLDLFLQGHAGDLVRVDRGSREPVRLDHPALTLGLSPQPGVLKGLADKPGFRSRGLLARFMYLLPVSNLGYRTLETKQVPESIKTNYHNLIFQLLNIETIKDEHGEMEPHVLTLSESAYQEWLYFSLTVEKEMRDDGRFEHIKDWAGKLPGAAARIAGLLHCEAHPFEPWTIEVSLKTIEAALDLATRFVDHSLIAFDLMGADASLEGARKVWRWVERNRFAEFTQRDCFNALKATFHKVDNIKESLKVLEERNYIQAETQKTGGRPSINCSVNPKIIQGWS